MSRSLRRALALTCACLCLGACAVRPGDKSEQLARVAKDWSLLIRASQVLATYPPTEDLLPGDIFLTTTPIGEEIGLYESRGFLPFDFHVARIEIEGLGDLYRSRARSDTGGRWSPDLGAWPEMPIVGFPTYSFSIARGAGVNLAVPVQGVPVALSLLGSASAIGTITLEDARTYGVDLAHIDASVRAWLEREPPMQDRLRAWGRQAALAQGRAYLRVVSRVFLVRSLSIQMIDTSGAGLQLAAGLTRPVDLLPQNVESSGAALESYTSAFDTLSSQISAGGALPGGSLKLVTASSRSVSMNETFARPLVIGYHAFDFEILPNGELGPGVTTIARVDPSIPEGVLGAGTQWTETLRTMLRDPQRGEQRRTRLRALLDERGLEEVTIAEFVRDPRYLDLQQTFARRLLSEE